MNQETPKQKADRENVTKEMAGWTEEQLEHFEETGEKPGATAPAEPAQPAPAPAAPAPAKPAASATPGPGPTAEAPAPEPPPEGEPQPPAAKPERDRLLNERLQQMIVPPGTQPPQPPAPPAAPKSDDMAKRDQELVQRLNNLEQINRRIGNKYSQLVQKLKQSGTLPEIDEILDPADLVPQAPVAVQTPAIEQLVQQAVQVERDKIMRDLGPALESTQNARLYNEVRELQGRFPYYATQDDVERIDRNMQHPESAKLKEIGNVIAWRNNNPDPAIRQVSLARAYAIYSLESGELEQAAAAREQQAAQAGQQQTIQRFKKAAALPATIGTAQGGIGPQPTARVSDRVKSKKDLAKLSQKELDRLEEEREAAETEEMAAELR